MGKIIISKIFAETNRPIDPDAFAFITAAGITDYGQKQAINKLVNDLKYNSLWNKFDCLYPMVGGDSTKHSFNLKNPLRYNLTFFGGWTHSATGALPNGTNGYADTGFSDLLTELNSNHLAYYSRTQSTRAAIELGASMAAPVMRNFLASDSSGFFHIRNHNNGENIAGATISKAFMIMSRTTSVLTKIYLNNVVSQTSVLVSSQKITSNHFIAVTSADGVPSTSYTDRECALASIGKGFSDAEITVYNTAVQAFQTSLNRNNP